jgi:hypothetical protein
LGEAAAGIKLKLKPARELLAALARPITRRWLAKALKAATNWLVTSVVKATN